jgi:UDP-N-acetylglucosamine transferase subunit ALG13
VRLRTGGRERLDVLLVSQQGGHLLELIALRTAWRAFSHAWVTLDAADSRSVLRGQRVFYGNGPTPRNLGNLLRNLLYAGRVLVRLRPKVIVTTGAALAVPFAWVGRLLGARIVYVELSTRLDRASLACRLIAPVADRVYVQWPEMLAIVPGARYAGRVSFAADDDVLALAAPSETVPEVGIFVTVGTCPYRFDRLLNAVDRLPAAEQIVAQTGVSSVRPSRARCVEFMSFDTFAAHMAQARTIITHAGVGSVMVAWACGKRPIVVARCAALGEQVDDHQAAFSRRLAELGLITLVEDLDRLPEVVVEHGDCRLATRVAADDRLVEELVSYLISVIRRGRARPSRDQPRPPVVAPVS